MEPSPAELVSDGMTSMYGLALQEYIEVNLLTWVDRREQFERV
jgi:hypothetical protein